MPSRVKWRWKHTSETKSNTTHHNQSPVPASELLTRCGVLEGMWKKDEPEFAKQSS
jgi:hypothetical protein